MKKAARRLATVSVVLASLALGVEMSGGCAAGSADATLAGSGEAGQGVDASRGDAARPNDDASVPGDGGHGDGASQNDDAATPPGDGAPGGDASQGGDATGGGDASQVEDAGGGDGDASDAAPPVLFGAACASGTTYSEPFTHDPVADGTFLPLIGPYTYNAPTSTLSLATGSPNTQLWIGARPSWTSYTVSVPVRIDAEGSNGNGGITFRMESTPASPANNAGQMYYAGIATNQVILGIENGNWTEFQGPSATFATGTFYTLEVTASGSSLSVSVNGTAYVTSYSDATYAFGGIGLRTYASGMTFGAITVTCN